MQASFTLWQTWQRPTLPRLETEYHRRWGVSRPSSEWDRVQPPRNNHQVGKRVRQTGLSISTGDSHAHQANAALVGPRPVPGHVEDMLRMSGPARAPPSRSGPRISARNSRVRELMSIALMRATKPIELLVPVSSTPCGASTPGLSTWSSSTALIGSTRFEVGFPLRCIQRLSRPYIATLHCGWRHNSSTRGTSIPVLSY